MNEKDDPEEVTQASNDEGNEVIDDEIINTAGLQFFEIEALNVAEWHPKPDGLGVPTEVHMLIKVKGAPHAFVMRFKSPLTIGRLITALRTHKNAVWPVNV